MMNDYYRGDDRGPSMRGGGRDRDYQSSSGGYERNFDRGARRGYKDERSYYDDPYYSSGQGFRGHGGERDRAPLNNPNQVDYRTLCLSNIDPRVPALDVKDAIYAEFKKFGDFNVKVVHTGDHRIAYVNFRSPEDARDAKCARSHKLVLFNTPIRVEPVHNNGRKSEYESGGFGIDFYSPPKDGGYDNRFQGGYGNRMHQDGHREHREHKFPHHLNHVKPEDDEKATRTLFVGNLEVSVGETELRQVFERYGHLQDVDVKRPQKGQGNAYAFVKFANLDMAHRAKVDMSGRFIGRLQCKIGYGKVNPTCCVWIGGVGPWISSSTLEAEFDRFGVIHKFKWDEEKNYAFVLYDSQDAAQAACKGMRGVPLGGPDRRIRVDFADASMMDGNIPDTVGPDFAAGNVKRGRQDSWNEYSKGDHPDIDRIDKHRNTDGPRDDYFRSPRDANNGSGEGDRWKFPQSRPGDDDGYRPRHSDDYPRGYTPPRPRERELGSPTPKRRRTSGEDQFGDRDRTSYSRDRNGSNGNYTRSRAPESGYGSQNFSDAVSIAEVAKDFPVVWSGALVLKTSAFPTRMHLVSGNVRLVDTLMRDQSTTEMTLLKITQRLRLDQPKLDDMSRRVSAAGPSGHAILLAMPGSETAFDDANENSAVQHRPLRNLVTYLKQKDAAGVISLPPTSEREQELGVLHSFPPCHFGQDYLLRRAPRLGSEPSKEDHLVVVVIGGSA